MGGSNVAARIVPMSAEGIVNQIIADGDYIVVNDTALFGALGFERIEFSAPNSFYISSLGMPLFADLIER